MHISNEDRIILMQNNLDLLEQSRTNWKKDCEILESDISNLQKELSSSYEKIKDTESIMLHLQEQIEILQEEG
jgi:peptidoglycan hydrolase CwlO-like protein